MAGYKCEKCGMSIGSMTCGQCGQELVHSTITKADGTSVLAAGNPVASALATAGFTMTPRGLRLRRLGAAGPGTGGGSDTAYGRPKM